MAERKDFSYTYNARGYMLYYKDRPIGGIGIDKYAKGHRSNIPEYKRQAELEIRKLMSGYGWKHSLDIIKQIDEIKGE